MESLFYGYAKLDEGLDKFYTFNGNEQYKINAFIVPAFVLDSDRFAKNSNKILLEYGKDILNLSLYDALFSIGIRGEMTVLDNGGNLSFILRQFISYELVISIVQKVKEGVQNIRYEPYIMNITNVEPVSIPGTKKVQLKISFEDLITSTAKKTSMATFLKENPSFRETKNFPDAFNSVLEYIKGIISFNNGGRFEYNKGLKFNKYTSASDVNSIIEPIVDELELDATLYDLLIALTKYGCIDIKPDGALIGQLETIGDVLVPLFCREEYSDIQNYYYSRYSEEDEEVSAAFTDIYVPRPFSLRNFYMPFENGFNPANKISFETFTTTIVSDQQKLLSNSIMGIEPTSIKKYEFVSANTDLILKHWRNLSFISSSANGGSNRLVYFNWIYEYFNRGLLQMLPGSENIVVSNVLPSFYGAELSDENIKSDKSLSEKNSSIILIRNEKADPVKEILMHMGKSVASLVFLNNIYSFEVKGNLLRRPNEIINLYTATEDKNASGEKDYEQSFNVDTDLTRSKNVKLYVNTVIHSFSGNTYNNKIICSQIYEKVI